MALFLQNRINPPVTYKRNNFKKKHLNTLKKLLKIVLKRILQKKKKIKLIL